MLGLGWSYGKLHRDLIKAVDKTCIQSLIFRCVQGALSVFISFMCLKYFSVSIVGIVCSLTPLIVCFLAYYILGEKIKTFDLISLIAVFASVCIIMIGGVGSG
jgi:drug/metabolite transporter (DMT)-like permease